MSYAQINYSQRLGTGPFTIAQAGCFLTAFCNLLARYGEPIDPPTLNNYFNQHGNFVDVDGDHTMDDLSYGTISAYDGRVSTAGIGGAGWPDSNDAIVKFRYKSKKTGNMTTHFCLVMDHASGTIVDSWDGVVKKSPYGTPVAWAKYVKTVPQVVVIPPPEAPAFRVENIPQVTKQLKVDTHLWDMNQRTWQELVNRPVAAGVKGITFETNRIARHIMGGSYYMPVGNVSQGYNTVDCVDPAPVPPPAPIPAPVPEPVVPPVPKTYDQNIVDNITYNTYPDAPKAMYINKVGGAEKWSFDNVENWRDFKSVQHLDYGTQVFIVGTAHHPIPPIGATYLMVDEDFGDFKKTGHVSRLCGFNRVDLSETKPPALPEPTPAPVVPVEPAPVVEATPVVVTPPVDPNGWKKTYVPFPKPAHYVAIRDLIVTELDGLAPAMPLKHYDTGSGSKVGMVSAYGMVTKDGIEYYRLRTNNDPTFMFYYAVPKLDPLTKTPLLLAVPTSPVEPVSKASVARDGIELARAHIENALPFLDDILPRWFKKKK